MGMREETRGMSAQGPPGPQPGAAWVKHSSMNMHGSAETQEALHLGVEQPPQHPLSTPLPDMIGVSEITLCHSLPGRIQKKRGFCSPQQPVK